VNAATHQRWLLLLPALVLAIGSVAWPALSLGLVDAMPTGRSQPPITAPDGAFFGTWTLFASSVMWTTAIAALATIGGWPLGLWIATALAAPSGTRPSAGASGGVRRRGGLLVFLTILPLCLPAYLMFWSLWQGIGAVSLLDVSWLGPLGLNVGEVGLAARYAVPLRQTMLVVGLAAWAMPLAAWTVAAWRIARPDGAAMLRSLDRASTIQRLAGAWRHDRGAILQGFAIASLGLLGESVSFDLAQVRTYGYELRALDATGSSPASVLSAGWPAVAMAALLLGVAARGRRRAVGSGDPRGRGVQRPHGPHGATRALGAIALGLALVPVVLLCLHANPWHEMRVFFALYARPAMSSLLLALACGAVFAIVAGSLATAWLHPARTPRRAALIIGAMWILAAATPATLIALAHESAWNRPLLGPLVYDSPLVLVLALTGRFGAIAVLSAALAARGEASGTRELRTIDAPASMVGWLRLARPPVTTAALTAFAAGTALAFSEIAVTSRLVPPRVQLLATSTLNAIHYQQPETVILASVGALLLGAAAAGIVVWTMTRRARLGGALLRVLPLVFCCACCAIGGCEPPPAGDGPPPIDAEVTRGTPGFGLGQFRVPRAVAYDPTSERFFVVDRQGRVQRFDRHGKAELEWTMPDTQVGKPVGIAVHPDGRVFVGDTHYHRVMVFTPEGKELARFGEYGTGPGQFIYPTDVAFGNDGRVYVGEYGGHDRIQIFTPEFRYAGEFGTAGYGEHELNRPQCLAFDGPQNELYVSDSNNHRIVVFDPDGRRLRQFGQPGEAPGDLSYPRGILPLGDGTMLVVEFGNHRIQRLDTTTGAPRGWWGGKSGDRTPLFDREGLSIGRISESDAGRLKYPWDLAGVAGRVAVLDSGNDRLMIAKLP